MNVRKTEYISLSTWFKEKYNGKVKKIALSGGFTCPNRDGILDSRGCIFCSEGGSGDFAVSVSPDDFSELQREIQRLDKEANEKQIEYIGYVAYFQAFTNTYADLEYLEKLYRKALSNDRVIGISIGTRPDCLDEKIVGLLKSLKDEFYDKFIWIEMGLQTIHDSTAEYIRRHYSIDRFEKAVSLLKKADIPFVVHVILGLPFETREMMLETVRYVNDIKPFGIKLQLLHVLENTDLADEFRRGLFEALTMEEYVSIVCDCIEILDKEIIIHRLTGDGDKEILIAPLWSGHKMTVLNAINHELKLRRD